MLPVDRVGFGWEGVGWKNHGPGQLRDRLGTAVRTSSPSHRDSASAMRLFEALLAEADGEMLATERRHIASASLTDCARRPPTHTRCPQHPEDES